MSLTPLLRTAPIAVVLAATAWTAGPVAQARLPLDIDTARVTIAGSSNIHEWTASTTKVRVTRVKVGPAVAGEAFWSDVVKPGALEAFELAISAGSLSSPKAGLDKNMHKALKVRAVRRDHLPPVPASRARARGAASPSASCASPASSAKWR